MTAGSSALVEALADEGARVLPAQVLGGDKHNLGNYSKNRPPDQEIADFGNPNGHSTPQKQPEKVGVSHPTYSVGFWGGEGRVDPQKRFPGQERRVLYCFPRFLCWSVD